jgi:hypothetical protein
LSALGNRVTCVSYAPWERANVFHRSFFAAKKFARKIAGFAEHASTCLLPAFYVSVCFGC